VADTISIGSAEFQVDLQQLGDAITSVSGDAETIRSDFDGIRSQLTTATTAWLGPAGSAFADFVPDLVTATDAMLGLLDEMVTRMRTAHANYLSAETANTDTFNTLQEKLTADGTGSGGATGGGSGSVDQGQLPLNAPTDTTPAQTPTLARDLLRMPTARG
jgi:WXG100 family type VII secretion target